MKNISLRTLAEDTHTRDFLNKNIKGNNKNEYKARRQTEGITLIALVITIIILLILAGVTIAMLTGNNGILTRAQVAKEEHQKAQVKEELELAINGIRVKYMELQLNTEEILEKLNARGI